MTRKYRALLDEFVFDVPIARARSLRRTVHRRYFAWREMAWEDDVVIVAGTCGRCGDNDVLAEVGRQLICVSNCLKTEENSIAHVVSRNQSRHGQSNSSSILCRRQP